MIDIRTAPYAALVLRLSLGDCSSLTRGLRSSCSRRGTTQFFGSLGLPLALAYVTIVWELAPPRSYSAWATCRRARSCSDPRRQRRRRGPVPRGFFFTSPNGGWEFPALWIVALVALAATGDGAFALLPTAVGGAKRADDRRYGFVQE